jgi:RNA polymerase sigma-B factor
MRTSYPIEQDERAAELVNALAALSPSDPGRADLRKRAIEAWLPMAYRLTGRYAGKGESFDDLLQTATVGLIKSVDGFDPARGTDFAGYAIPTVQGEIKRYFRDRAWSLRVPRRLQDMRLSIGRARAELTQVLNGTPTVADIAVHLDVAEEAVREGVEGSFAYRAISLAGPLGDGSDRELGDVLGLPEPGYERVELTVSLPPAMARLTERERRIVALRFYGNQTQSSIAGQLGVSQMHVSRLLAGALRKLRAHLTEAG